VLRFADCPRAPLLLLRLRVAAADFVRDEPPEERDDPLRDERAFEPVDPVGLAFDCDPFDEVLLFCLLREAALLLLAIRDPSPIEDNPSCLGYPPWRRDNHNTQGFHSDVVHRRSRRLRLALGHRGDR
jgi:hypothetical protein